MESITLSQASKLTSPNPVVLVCSPKPDGGTNLATVSWWTYLSFKPGMVAFAMGKKSFSGELVRANGRVILAVPGTEIAKEVLACGSSSGRNTNKIVQFGIDMQKLPDSDIQVPLHCRVAISCSLKEVIEVGDHYLHICDVKQVYSNEAETAVYAWNGYSEIRPV